MTNISPTLLDRLALALARRNITVKRTDLLGIAAEAFGCRNANTFTAALKSGEIAFSQAPYLGTLTVDGHEVALVLDPTSGKPFGLVPPASEVRSDRLTVSPYGGLVSIVQPSRPSEKRLDRPMVYGANIEHRHGQDTYLDLDPEGLLDQIYAYCEEYWSEACEASKALPRDITKLSRSAAVDAYFAALCDVSHNERVTYFNDRLELPVLRAQAAPRYVIGMTRRDDDPSLWWSNADGWGCLSTATVFGDCDGDLPGIGEDRAKVGWYLLP